MKKHVCIFLIITLLSVISCKKEVVTGDISGTVSDQSGGISSAKIELLDSKNVLIQSTITDSRGGFGFKGVPEGIYTLEVTKENYSGKSKSIQVSGGILEVNIDLQLLLSEIQGNVTDQSLNDIMGVNVSLLKNSLPVKTSITDNSGNFYFEDVPYGTYQLLFEKEGYTSKTQEITVTANTPSVNISIQARKGILEGKVTDNFGGVLENAFVILKQNAVEILTENSGSDGTFSFGLIFTGSYTIEVTLPGFEAKTVTADLDEAGTSVIIELSPESEISGGILSAQIISYSSVSAKFVLDVFVTTSQSTPNTSLTANDFSIGTFESNGMDFTFIQDNFTTTTSQYTGPYSAGMLIDQSGSISTTDPNNARIQASKIFLSALGSGDNVSLAAFSTNLSPVPQIYGYGFTSVGSSYYNQLDALANNNSGGTPLYKAIYNLIGYTSNQGTNPNKAVVVFTDGEDTDGGYSIDDISSLSVSTGVKVFTVGLSSSVNTTVLGEIAARTGGAFMWASDAKQLVSIYGNLGNILHGSAFIYRISWNLFVTGGAAFPGSLTSSIKVVTSNGTFYIPFYIAPGSSKTGSTSSDYSSVSIKKHID